MEQKQDLEVRKNCPFCGSIVVYSSLVGKCICPAIYFLLPSRLTIMQMVDKVKKTYMSKLATFSRTREEGVIFILPNRVRARPDEIRVNLTPQQLWELSMDNKPAPRVIGLPIRDEEGQAVSWPCAVKCGNAA